MRVVIPAALASAFALLAAGRLNELSLLDPDSSDYLIQSNSLATFRGYSRLELPHQPMQTLRPPGLSIVLVPSQLLFPYGAVAAKCTIALCGMVLLFLVFRFAARTNSVLSALAATAVLTLNPYMILFGTEVSSEVPYAMITLALLFLLEESSNESREWRYGVAAALLALLVLLRSVGVAFVLALAVWALPGRRRRWILALAVGAASAGAWHFAATSLGEGSYAAKLSEHVSGMETQRLVRDVWGNGRFHFEQLLAQIVPGAATAPPDYWLVMSSGTTAPALPKVLLKLFAGGVLLCGIVGLCRRGSPAGVVGLVYVGLYFATICVWPFRQSRFTWPLVPILLASAPQGLRVFERASRDEVFRRGASAVGAAAVVTLMLWQGSIVFGMITTNRRWLAERRDFSADWPPEYYSDLPAAGRWIAEQTPPSARILTDRAALACTARRHQRHVRFSNLSTRRLHEAIQIFGARYLVVAGLPGQHAFPWHLLEEDPVYRFEIVHREGGVTVLAVEPNREGTVAGETTAVLAGWEDSIRHAVERHPDRPDLGLELARTLFDEDRHEEVIATGRRLTRDGYETAFVYGLMGMSLRATGRRTEALETLRKSLFLAEAGELRSDITETIALTEREIERGVPTAPAVEELLAAAQWHFDRFEYRKAMKIAGGLPDRADARLLRGRILARMGHREGARAELEAAKALGRPEAELDLNLLDLIDFPHPSKGNEGLTTAAECVRHADALVGAGVPGRALALLEEHSPRFETDVDFLLMRAKLERFYGSWNAAEKSLLAVLRSKPNDTNVQKQLNAVRALQAPTRF